MIIEESGISFEFYPQDSVIKFDESKYYDDRFRRLSGGKGVDFIVSTEEYLVFLEVKNFKGHEIENRWRTVNGNRKLPQHLPREDSLDCEVSKKLAMTLACLIGAHSNIRQSDGAGELDQYFTKLSSNQVLNGKKKIMVILFLEGDFEVETRRRKTILKSIQDSIKEQLGWLNCGVSVINSDTYNPRFFHVN